LWAGNRQKGGKDRNVEYEIGFSRYVHDFRFPFVAANFVSRGCFYLIYSNTCIVEGETVKKPRTVCIKSVKNVNFL
ncbi:MAG TPA: hypothetical protein PKJ84_15690, partial [Anaerolineales bacterium]|nr:hypothetical protein [Anaerolineales bacterium]